MKLIDEGIKKFGSLSELHRELVRQGVNLSLGGLQMSQIRQSRSIRFDVLAALVICVYDGDWAKAGKAIEREEKENT